MSASDLVERGIRAFGRGRLGEAERCWRDAIALEPRNARARAYLEELLGKLVGEASPEGAASPVPLPPPAPSPAVAPAADDAPQDQDASDAAAVPLPAPARDTGWAAAAFAWPPAPARSFAPVGGDDVRPFTVEDLSATAAAAAAEPRRSASVAVPLDFRAPARSRLTELAPSPWDEPPQPALVQVDEGAGLDLASVEEQSSIRPLVPEQSGRGNLPARPRRGDVEVWMEGAREQFALGDFSGSLETIEKILRADPDHPEARAYLAQNEATLIAMYESKLGPQSAVPRLAIQPEEVMWLNLDHRAGFLLAQIDGAISYEDLFALSGLPRLDTARILAALLQEGVIGT